MTTKTNKEMCQGSNKNVGYYYKITFPVCNASTYNFRLPNSYSYGSMVTINSIPVDTNENLDFSVYPISGM
jgi:hypothetical protein